MKKLLQFSLLPLCLLLLLAPSLRISEAAENSILDVASANGSFTSLAALINEVGLASMLENNGPFTVFAPTDDAFAALGDTLAGLNETQKRQIVLYHIVQGERDGASLNGVGEVGTALGQLVTIAPDASGNLVLNGTANVTTPDVDASNGVIHVVDAVLIPSGVLPTASADSDDTANTTTSNTGGSDALEDLFFDPDGPYGDARVTFELAELESAITLVPALRDYNQLDFTAAAVISAAAVEEMRNMLDSGLGSASKDLCNDYTALFILMAVAPRFENAGDAQAFVNRYEAGITRLLDSNRPFALYCLNDGNFSQINWGLARIGAQDAMDVLIPLANEMLALADAPVVVETPADSTTTNETTTDNSTTTDNNTTTDGTTTDGTTTDGNTDATAGSDEKVSFDTEEELDAALEEAFDRLYGNPAGDFADPRASFDIPNITDEDEAILFAVPHVDYANFDFFTTVTFLNVFISDMGGQLDAIGSQGNAAACLEYMSLYLTVARSPKFRNVPAARQGLVDRYEAALGKLLDNNLPFVLYCANGGQFSSFNKFLARDGVEKALDEFIPLLVESANVTFE